MSQKIVWIFQIIIAAIFIPVGILKFTDNPSDILIFTTLGMEPEGRYIIGALEALSGLMALTSTFAATGSFLAIGVMLGATIAHTMSIGFNVNGDSGMHLYMLFAVLVSSLVVVYIRRKQLPVIGDHFKG